MSTAFTHWTQYHRDRSGKRRQMYQPSRAHCEEMLTNHVERSHQGVFHPECRGCQELQQKLHNSQEGMHGSGSSKF